MKNIITFLLIVLVVSCSKEKNSSPTSNQLADSIVSVICDSTYSIQSVSYFTPSGVPMNCDDIPTPYDRMVERKIDLDNDSIDDFVIRANHSATNWCSSHCQCWDYTINIFGLDTTNKISCKPENGLPAIAYDTTMSVSNNGTWDQNVSILLNIKGYPFSISFIQGYIGIRKNNNYGWILISPYGLNGISIKEFAFNHTASNPIRAGRK